MIRKSLFFCALSFVAGSIYAEGEFGNMGQKSAVTEILVTISDRVFEAELMRNEASDSFLNRLPLTIDMKDLNSNEKYYYFKNKIPANAQSIERITVGDLVLYGDDCLVIFYKDFRTAYQYTRLGRITNTEGFVEALGFGTVKVTFRKKIGMQTGFTEDKSLINISKQMGITVLEVADETV